MEQQNFDDEGSTDDVRWQPNYLKDSSGFLHIAASQVVSIKSTEGKLATVYLARLRNNIFTDRDNNFYFKHVITPSKKVATSTFTPPSVALKLERRHAIRQLTGAKRERGKMDGNKAELFGKTKGQGFTKSFAKNQLTWAQKYGTEKGGDDSTAIDLSLLAGNEFQLAIQNALSNTSFGGTKKQIGTALLKFNSNCVISLRRRPCNYMYVEVEKIERNDAVYYDIYHFAYTKQERHTA
mgnify:CR=1 FL=1